MVIKSVKARQIFDSRGNPTVEDMFFVLYGDIIRLRGEFQVEVVLDDGTFTTVAVPIGASTENVDPKTEKVKKSKKKHAELLMKDEESPPKLDQEFGDQRKVAKTPPEKVKESKKKHAELLKEKEESAPKPYREFGDQRKVAKRPPENVDPQTEKVKESKKKHAELLREKEESAPKPYREFGDQRKVAKTPPENVDPQTEKVKKSKKIQHELLRKEEESPTKPDREFSDQLKVAKTPPDHISKPMAIKVHDCYLAHDHKLELKSYNDPFKCSRCKEDGFTLGYGCKLCDYNLHKECWNPKPKITHKLFPGSTFEFCEKPLECRRICDECDNYRRICDACGTRIYGCSYHCKAHGWDLHPRCGNLPKQLRSNGMDFVLISKIVKQRCFWCKEKLHSQLVEKEVPGWWYVSKPNGFYCHVYCVFQIVLEAWKRGALVRNDDDDDNDGTSKALEKVNLKHVAKSNGSGGRGGRWFSMLTAILKIIVGVLSGDPTGWIVLAAELLQN